MNKIRINGFEQAIEALQGLNESEQKKIIENISKSDPKMAELLQKSLVVFEDLIYLTPDMIRLLLREIRLEDMGLALRGCSEKLRDHFRNNLSKNLSSDLNEILLGPPKRLSEVQEAQANIMEKVREKIAKGEIVLDKKGSETYVE